jgi:hypothetical protein
MEEAKTVEVSPRSPEESLIPGNALEINQFKSDDLCSQSLVEQKRLIVVRHGERIDEVDADLWYRRKSRHSRQILRRRRCDMSDDNDPNLTEEGLRQAEAAAEKIIQDASRDGYSIDCIFSSKLIRAVQTAHKLAIRLNIPIVLSSSLAQSAAAVSRMGERFDFLAISELAHFAPGVELLDDESTVPSSWESHLLDNIAARRNNCVVFAHRETIRDLVPEFSRRKVPYCGMALFSYSDDLKWPIKIDKIIDKEGNTLFKGTS